MILDPIIPGGLPYDAAITLVGPPGSGKTCLCLQLVCEAITKGRDAVFLTTENLPSTIIHQAKDLGFPFADKPEKNRIQFIDAYGWRIGARKDPFALARISNPGNLNEVNLIITDQAKLLKPGSLIVIDSVSGLNLAAPDEQRIRTFVHSLALRISSLDKILILVLEDGAHDTKLITNLFSLVQGSISTKAIEEPNGQLSWHLRMNSLIGTKHSTKWFRIDLSKNGLMLAGGAFSE